MFFKRPEKEHRYYEAHPVSGVDLAQIEGNSLTVSIPTHEVVSRSVWSYDKMEDVPFPIGEDWVWVDCYKALSKTRVMSEDKISYTGPSRDFIYEFNKVYALPEDDEEYSEISYCGNGFHACLTIKDALSWFNFVSCNTNFSYYGAFTTLGIITVAKAKLLVNKKDLENCYGLRNHELDKGKIVGKAIILTDLISPEEVYENRKEDVLWSIGVLNSNAIDYLKKRCSTKGIDLNIFQNLTKELNITLLDYKKMLNFIEAGKIPTMAYISTMFDAYMVSKKEIYQVLNADYGPVLADEIVKNLDYRLAMKLSDADNPHNRCLSLAEKMQILYSHQILLKK